VWTLDRAGLCRFEYDYQYTGPEMSVREAGIRLLAPKSMDRLSWRRWSEWGEMPADHIGRTSGRTRARRQQRPDALERDVPDWPWRLDQTERGTADFRSVRLNVLSADLTGQDAPSVHVLASADKHVRACLDPRGVWLHILDRCAIAPWVLRPGDRLKGCATVQITMPRR
jgi:hypothetical protein